MKAAFHIAALLAVLLTLSARNGSAMSYSWHYHYTGANAQGISSVAVDALDNIYVAGNFYGTTNFGGGNRTSAGGADIVVVKYDANGLWLWDRTYGDASDGQFANDIAVDAANNVYISGGFDGSVNFGLGALTSLGSRDLFLAKLNTSGTTLWAKRFGDAQEQQPGGITLDLGSAVYFTGWYRGSPDFGGGPLTNNGLYDAFLVKLSSTGVHQWSKRFGDAGDQRGIAVATDHWTNVYLGMDFTGTIDVGNGNVTSAGNFDIEVVQYGPTGNYQWSGRYGDAANQFVQAIETQFADGYPYVTGSNAGVVDFGGGPITSAGGLDIFLAKFDCFGGHMWSKGFGDASDQSGLCLAVDTFGDVCLAGDNSGTVNFGGAPITSQGNQDIFLVKFTSLGALAWAHGYGDAQKYQIPGDLAVDIDGHLNMVGGFQGLVNFGGGALNGPDLDSFLVQFGPSPTDVHTPLRTDAALWSAPNPFNPVTVVHFDVAQRGHVRLDIFDARGAHVATLVDHDLHAGTFRATWNATDKRGGAVSSGVYFARLSTGSTQVSMKLVLLK